MLVRLGVHKEGSGGVHQAAWASPRKPGSSRATGTQSPTTWLRLSWDMATRLTLLPEGPRTVLTLRKRGRTFRTGCRGTQSSFNKLSQMSILLLHFKYNIDAEIQTEKKVKLHLAAESLMRMREACSQLSELSDERVCSFHIILPPKPHPYPPQLLPGVPGLPILVVI